MREEDIPIDINYSKLLDWLIDRRHCDLKWQQNIIPIRQKIQDSLESFKESEKMTEIPLEPSMNYFHCQKIKRKLEESGEGSKTIFGQYSSQLMKAWDEILQMYQSGNVYLAESSAELMRNVNYEIPSLKKQIGKCQQTQRDCNRKEGEYVANAASFKEKYFQSCKEIGIHGVDIKKELLQLVTELPDIHRKIAETAKELKDSVEYYEEFTNFVVSSGCDQKVGNRISVCPLLSFVIKHGNATVHQWKTGEEPTESASLHQGASSNTQDSSNAENTDEIDWGDLNQETTAPADFSGDGIDWGGIDTATSGIEGIDFGESDTQIDWSGCIEVVDTSANGDVEGIVVKKDDSPPEGLDTVNEDCLTVLDCARTRNHFTDELIEVEAFLDQRRFEMDLEADVISVNQFQSAPVLLQLQTAEKVSLMQRKVRAILNELGSRKMQNLYLLKSSERFVHRIADSLQQKLKIAENMLRQARLVADRRREALELQKNSEPALHLLISKTKELQKQISLEISKKYKNRTVNIMGDINTI